MSQMGLMVIYYVRVPNRKLRNKFHLSLKTSLPHKTVPIQLSSEIIDHLFRGCPDFSIPMSVFSGSDLKSCLNLRPMVNTSQGV